MKIQPAKQPRIRRLTPIRIFQLAMMGICCSLINTPLQRSDCGNLENRTVSTVSADFVKLLKQAGNILVRFHPLKRSVNGNGSTVQALRVLWSLVRIFLSAIIPTMTPTAYAGKSGQLKVCPKTRAPGVVARIESIQVIDLRAFDQ
jgi:hypothetical protein